MKKEQDLNNAETQALNIPGPRLFFVVARDSEETWEQITNGFDTYEKAKAYRDSDYCKKRYPYAFVVASLNEG